MKENSIENSTENSIEYSIECHKVTQNCIPAALV